MRFFIAALFLTLGAANSWGGCSGGFCSRDVLASGASNNAVLGAQEAISNAEELIEEADELEKKAKIEKDPAQKKKLEDKAKELQDKALAELAQAKVDQQSAIENAQAAHKLNNGHQSSGSGGGSDEMPMQPPQQQPSQKKDEKKEEKNEPDPNSQYLQPVDFQIPQTPDAVKNLANTPSQFSKIVPPEQLLKGWKPD